MPALHRILLALLSLLVAGCSALAAPSARSTSASPVAQAQATHEYTSTAPPTQAASGGRADPVEAIRAFVIEYINWNPQDVAAHMRALAVDSVGQARSAMELAAAQTAQDYELQRGGIANRGTVEAIAQLTGRRNQFAVVTRELTTASATSLYQGLRPAWHVAVATVTQLGPDGWVLSGWQPES